VPQSRSRQFWKGEQTSACAMVRISDHATLILVTTDCATRASPHKFSGKCNSYVCRPAVTHALTRLGAGSPRDRVLIPKRGSKESTRALGPTRSYIRRLPVAVFTEIKRPGLEANRRLPNRIISCSTSH
jgi:hypothetical protein